MMATGQKSGTGQQWRADVYVTLKSAVNDPQGLAVRDGLHMLGFESVEGVRVGKYLQVWLDSESKEGAAEALTEMCEKLLANTVIEEYSFDIKPV